MRDATRNGFGRALCQIMAENDKVVVVTADLRTSTRVAGCRQQFPNRFFDVGVAEQNLAGLAAGLALGGKIVFATSFACFSPAINWAQIRQSICYNNLNVKIVGSHAGLATGPDGATHQMLEDIALATVLPKMTVVAPADSEQAAALTRLISQQPGPAYLRLNRPKTLGLDNFKFNLAWKPLKLGLPQKLNKGERLTIVGFGPILPEFLHILPPAKWQRANIFNVHTLKPFNPKPILSSLRRQSQLIVIEDHQRQGGLGSLLGQAIASAGLKVKWQHLAVNGQFGHSARNFRALWRRYIFTNLKLV